MLKMNDDKTIVLLMSSRYCEIIPFPDIKLGDALVPTSDNANNLGVVFDSHMTM